MFLQKRKARRKAPLDSSAEGDSESGAGDEDEDGAGDGDEEPSASEKARQAFLKCKLAQDVALLDCAKSFAMAGVPVLTVRSELCEGTLLDAVRSFLDRFLSYRRSLLLSPQCIPLTKASHTGFICLHLKSISLLRFRLWSSRPATSPQTRSPVLLYQCLPAAVPVPAVLLSASPPLSGRAALQVPSLLSDGCGRHGKV